jgi:hypothetical protein
MSAWRGHRAVCADLLGFAENPTLQSRGGGFLPSCREQMRGFRDLETTSASLSSTARIGPVLTTSLPYPSVLCPQHLLSFPRPAQTALLAAMLVILFLSPIGSLCCVWDPVGTGGSFCPTGEPVGIDLLSWFVYNSKFRKTDCFASYLLSRWVLAWLILRPWRWRRHGAPKRRLTLNGLHAVISQKIELFTATAVRTSNPTYIYTYL